jgi:hypothetical protein
MKTLRIRNCFLRNRLPNLFWQEEDYEWGNPGKDFLQQGEDSTEAKLASAARRTRQGEQHMHIDRDQNHEVITSSHADSVPKDP